MDNAQIPPHAQVLHMVNSMITARSIALSADLSIADKLGDESRSVEELATELSVHPESLYRMMRLLAGAGVFRELPERRFENNDRSSALRSDAPHSVKAICRWLGHPMHWKVIGGLDYSLATGNPALKQDHPDSSPLDVLFADEGARAVFGQAMAEVSSAQHRPIIAAYDFSPHSRIVDVGGGHGSFAQLISQSAPESQITVFDLPHVAQAATAALAANPNKNIRVAPGSFLESVPGPADLCVLKWILHLWSDDVARGVLENCHAALESGGHVLLIEMLIEPGPQAAPARTMDIEMLTGSGGRERTREEFEALLASAGFEVTQVITTPTPVRLIEARRK